MTRIRLAVCGCALLLAGVMPRAASEERESADAPTAEQTERKDADDVEDSGADEEKSPEVFTPSEDISEDVAVPFPVDI